MYIYFMIIYIINILNTTHYEINVNKSVTCVGCPTNTEKLIRRTHCWKYGKKIVCNPNATKR